MSSTLSKIFKTVLALVLVVCLCVPLSGCVRNTRNIKNIDQICVSGAYTESWMYVFTDDTFINDMIEIYNTVEYEKTDEVIDLMTAGEVYFFSFSYGNNNQTKFIVNKNGIMTFEAGTECYKIVSDFDFSYIEELVQKQIDASKSKDATADEA